MKTTAIHTFLFLLTVLIGGSLAAQTYPLGNQDPTSAGFTSNAPLGTVDFNWGWKFRANANDLTVTELGCNFPAGSSAVTVTLFDASSQQVLAQEVCGPGAGWQFESLTNPVPLVNGGEYVITGLVLSTNQSFSHGTPPATWIPTGDIEHTANLYALSTSASAFPTADGNTTLWGVVDFGYSDGLVITAPARLPNAGELTAYNESLTVTAGTAPYTWSLTSGALPNGLSLNQSGDDFVLSGTPVTGTQGSYSFDVQVTDANNVTASKTISLDVDGLLIPFDSMTDAVAGTSYSQDIQANHGATPYSWTMTSGTLPPGLSIVQTGNSFRVTGTPDPGSEGLYTFDVEVTDALNATATETISLYVRWPAGADTYPLTQQDPVAGGFTTFNTYGSYAKWGWRFRVNSDGITVLRLAANFLVKQPVIVTIFEFSTQTIIAQQTVGTGAGWQYANLPTPVSLDQGKEYIICGYQTTAQSGYYNYNMPASWMPTGDIEWLMGQHYFYSTLPSANVMPSSTNSTRMGGVVDFGYAKTLSITTDETLPSGEELVAYSQTIQATAGTTPYTWSHVSGIIPSGLSLTQVGDDYVLSGTPAAGTPGYYTFDVKVTDAVGYSYTRTMEVSITWPPSHYTYPLAQQDPGTAGFNSSTSTYTRNFGWRFKANSHGLSVLRLGSNFPQGSSNQHVVTLWDVSSQTQLAQVTCGPGSGWQFTDLANPVSLVSGQEYVVTGFTTAGYYYDSSLAASWMPTGDIEYLHAQYISSSTTTKDTYPTTIRSNYMYGVVDIGYARSLSVITDPILPSGAEQTPYSKTIQADFGTTPYSWTLVSGSLPSGLSLAQSGNNFELSGTPATGTAGTYNVAVKVTDAVNDAHTKTLTLHVYPQPSSLPFTDDFSTDKGWQFGTDWTRGSAVGYTNTAPNRSEPANDNSPSSDNYIAGHKIGDDYEPGMTDPVWLTSPPIDCSNVPFVTLNYYRFLGTTLGDVSKVQVTNNGSTWHDVWVSPPSTNINDSAWTYISHDITQWAAGNSVVQVRFGVGPTGNIVNTGWCIDDVVIHEPSPELEVREGGLVGTIITDNQAVGGLRDFGMVAPSTNSQVLTIGLENKGPNTITFSPYTKTGTNAGDFYIVKNPPASLAPGHTGTMEIQFYSSNLGVKTAKVTLPHDASYSGSSPFEINVRAEVVVLAPSIEVNLTTSGGASIPHQSPAAGTARDFGSVIVGNTSQLVTIAVSNTGNGTLNLTAIDMGGTWWNQYAVNAGPMPMSVAPGSSMTFTVSFQPQSTGSKDAYVRIWHDDTSQPYPYEVNVIGDGVNGTPVIGVSDGVATIAHNDPANGARDFGTLLVGATSAPATITISNTGNTDLVVGAVNLGGPDAGEFSLTTTGFGSPVAPGTSTSFKVSFAPTSAGVKNATVSFTHDDLTVTSPFIINVTGTGAPAAPMLEVRAGNANGTLLPNPAPASGVLDFGSRDVAAGPTAGSLIYVKNAGTAPLTLGLPALVTGIGDFVLDTTGFPSSLAAGASASFSIAFDPAQNGPLTGSVSFTHNDGTTATPFVINTKGTGIAPVVEAREGSVGGAVISSGAPAATGGGRDCGSIDISAGATSPITIVLVNTGSLNLVLGTPSLGGANASEFNVNTTGMSTTLVPGSSTSFEVTFDPVQGGIKNANVVFTHNDPANPSPFLIPVKGTGVDPNGVAISTDSLPFGTSDESYPATQLQAVRGVAPYTWSIYSGTLPDGLTLSSDGVLSGTPYSLVTSDYTFVIRVKDAVGATHEKEFVVQVAGSAMVSEGGGEAGCSANSGNSGWLLVLALLAISGIAIRRRAAGGR